MEEHIESLKQYILQQTQAGLQPVEILGQLRSVGWPEEIIQQAFQAVQSYLDPLAPPARAQQQSQLNSPQSSTPESVAQPVVTSPQSTAEPYAPAQPQPTTDPFASDTNPYKFQSSADYQRTAAEMPQANGKRRGRLRTSWLLLKQSLRVLQMHRSLVRYPIMSGIMTFLIGAILLFVFFLGKNTLLVPGSGSDDANLTPLGYLVAFVYYVIVYFIINMYNAGLAAHVLDIFQGRQAAYKDYMKRAWAKGPTLFLYAIIAATVGIILEYIIERFRLLGRIIAYFIGAVWSLANLFTIPVIMTSDDSAPRAIKHSLQLFKRTWGENIISRVTINIATGLLLLLLIPVILILFVGLNALGPVGAIIGIVLSVALVIAFSIISTTASSILNIALFHYASQGSVPPAFDGSLLNSVFIQKKPKK